MRHLAVDIGQSGSRVRTDDGFDFPHGPAFDAALGVLGSVEQTLTAAGLPQADVVALSLTGLRGEVPTSTTIGERTAQLTGAQAVAVADDGYAAHQGALAGTDGVVLAVGSGVAVVARRGAQAAHRDGDGPVLGDDGGGFWIGRAGLRAALRASEGRGVPTALQPTIEAEYGPLRTLVRSRTDAEAMRLCIDVARTVLQLAATGDAVAQHIRDTAAARLAETAAAAWRAVGAVDAHVPVSYTGGVMADAPLRAALADHLGRLLPNAEWRTAIGDNLDGALLIAGSTPQDVPPLLRWWLR